MHKIKLIIRGGFDGQTPVTQAPTFRLVEGWSEAELEAPAGLFPAGLWGQVPAGDPYLVHACMLTTLPIDQQTIFEVQTGAPAQIRTQFTPSVDNTRLTLVRPSDTLKVATPPQNLVKLELLVESIGGTNELGSRLYEWANVAARPGEVRIARLSQPATLAAWRGVLHLIYDSAAGANLTLPPRQTVPVDAVLTLTRRSGGLPTLIPAAGDSLAGGLGGLTIQRSAIVMNNGDQWTWSGQ